MLSASPGDMGWFRLNSFLSYNSAGKSQPAISTQQPIISKSERRIAIVEDEKDMLSVYSIYFKRLGYGPVITFNRGEDLLAYLNANESFTDFVIIDYRLPGVNGIEIAKRALERRPGLKVIITTADDSIANLAESLGVLFLRKPFSLSSLAGMIENG